MYRALVLIGALVWCAFVYLVSPTLYWRDGGEFILTAFFLDIAHPAGFPTYAMFANLFAHLPFGPIAWRVQLFSAFVSTALILVTVVIAQRLLTSLLGLRERVAFLCALGSVPIFIGSIAFLHQAGTAEVYVLNALFLAVLFGLYGEWCRGKTNGSPDCRVLFLAAFVSGVGLGNHASLAPPLLLALILLGFDYKLVGRRVLHLVGFGILGLSVYGYHPLRSEQPVPLRTGEPSNIERLFTLLTDGRDRHLKSVIKFDGPKKDDALVTPFLGQAARDLRVLSGEVSSVLLLVGAIGMFRLLRINWQVGGLLLSTCGIIWFFFKGWQPYPWIPLLFGVAIGNSLFIGSVCSLVKKPGPLGSTLAAVALVASILLSVSRNALSFGSELREYRAPAEYARRVLDALPEGSVYVTEASWFPLAYARYIEQYRSDVALVYQPRLLFPSYFEPHGIDQIEAASNASPTAPQLDSLGGLTKLASQRAIPFVFEPGLVVNPYFGSVAFLNERGVAEVTRSVSPGVHEGYVGALLAMVEPCLESARGDYSNLAEDALSQLETVVGNAADALLKADRVQSAYALHESLCLQIAPRQCSSMALRNIAVLRELLLRE